MKRENLVPHSSPAIEPRRLPSCASFPRLLASLLVHISSTQSTRAEGCTQDGEVPGYTERSVQVHHVCLH